MVTFNNVTELKEELAEWLNRTDLNHRLDRFIGLAEANFRDRLFHRNQLTRASTTLFEGDEFIQLPTDFVKQYLFYIEGPTKYRKQLKNVTQAELVKLYPNDMRDIPTAYSIVGSEAWLTPKCSGTMSIEMNYYAKVPSLLEYSSNWLLSQYPDIYLYGTLAVANAALQNNDEATKYNEQYEKAVSGAMYESNNTLFDMGPLQINIDGPIY